MHTREEYEKQDKRTRNYASSGIDDPRYPICTRPPRAAQWLEVEKLTGGSPRLLVVEPIAMLSIFQGLKCRASVTARELAL